VQLDWCSDTHKAALLDPIDGTGQAGVMVDRVLARMARMASPSGD
jgi:hypothetical protein